MLFHTGSVTTMSPTGGTDLDGKSESKFTDDKNTF